MEHDFHNWLRNHTSIQGLEKSVILGIGDDGAILPESSAHTVVTTDTIAEGTHFDTSIHSLEQIGRKAIAVNLSDIAAMGAMPTHAVLTLLMPRHFSLDEAIQLYSGILEIASNYNVTIIGGDTNRWDGNLVIGATLIGQRSPSISGWKLDGAQAADRVVVSGSFGGSISGHHLSFEPRIELANYLAGRYEIHAATDVSDSLSLDLQLLANASNVGLDIEAEKIPISNSLKAANSPKPLDGALYDGEDFELILTVAPAVFERIKLDSDVPCQLTDIGEVTPKEQGLRILDSHGTPNPMIPRGYIH